LKRIESHAFDGLFSTIVIPETVLCVASDLGGHRRQLLFVEGHSCDEFDDWLRMRKSGISVDFRCLLRFVSGHLDLESYQLDDSDGSFVRG
jgi:hypothetical protein